MQLRTAFITADDSGDGELSLNEVSPIYEIYLTGPSLSTGPVADLRASYLVMAS